ncbi:MAG: hypothetical protein RLZZ63_168 [Gemmatimonadota bacterium]|jgi:glycosyltransferase involved in cell wall biosynthesis
MRIALVHEWLLTYGGSEEITAELQRLFPEADQFALLADPVPALRARLDGRDIRTTFLQRLPGATRWHRLLLPLLPAAVASLDLRVYDLVISVSHAVAKSVRTGPRQVHLCICCSPMRYAWDLREAYLRETRLDRGVRGWIARRMLDGLRRWDRSTADRPTEYLAISEFIGERISRAYGRSARILYPPVDTDFFRPAMDGERSPEEPYWLTASRFVPYKRIPLIVEAFAAMPSRRLLVVGDGPERPRVEAVARNTANVTMLGQVPRVRLRELLQGARGFVFAAEEDFGIAPVEAMACGVPVVAYGKGGARETVQGDPTTLGSTGVYFESQTVESIREGVESLEAAWAAGRITAAACRARAERFSSDAFRAGVRAEVARVTAHLAQTVASS